MRTRPGRGRSLETPPPDAPPGHEAQAQAALEVLLLRRSLAPVRTLADVVFKERG